MKIVLVMFTPEGERRDVPVKKSHVVLGRDHHCDIRIPVGAVSRRHCELSLEDDGLYVEDLESRNGTYRNDAEITEKVPLEPGDRLAVGPVVFTVQIDGVPEHVEMPLLESPMVVTHPEDAAPKSAEPAPMAEVDPDDSSAGISDLLSDVLDGSSEFDFNLDDLED